MIGGWWTLARKQVIVNLDTGVSFEGVLFATSGPLLRLRNAKMFERGREPVAVDGEVVVDRRRVEFVQVTTAVKQLRPAAVAS